MATVEDLPTARVTGQYLFVSQDNADEGTRPNAVLVTGYVRFTCSATPPILYKNKRVSAVPLVHDAAFDSEGFLIPLDAAQNTPIVVNGKLERGIELLADSPEASPRGFTWNVSFNLREVITGRTIQIPAFDILVKEGEDYDLVDYMPVGRSNGVGIIKGDSAYELAVANGFKGTQADWLESIKGASGDGYVIPQMQIAPRADIPTITCSPIDVWSGAPTIEGSAGWFREKRVDAGERAPGAAQGDGKPLDLNGSSYFSYPALPAASDWANNSGRIVISDMKPGGDAQWATWLFNVEFITSSPEVEFFMNAGTTNGRFGTVLVNGKRIAERAIRHTGVAGEGMGVKLTFPSAKERTIRVYGLNNGAGRFGGVAVAQGYTVVKPKVRPARKIAFIGDSFVNGTDEVSSTETFVWRLADLLGADEVLQAGIGGTGFASGDVATRFANRIDAVLAYNPDVIVFAGGRNDSATGLQEAVTNTLARAGNKELYVVSTASDATQAAVNDALAAGAAAAGVPFVRADVDALPREDAVHLTYAGHQAFADQLFARLISMKANSIPTEQAVAGYLTTPSSPVYKAVESTTRRTAQPIVGELVTEAIAADGTVAKSAAAAVGEAVASQGLINGQDNRISVLTEGDFKHAWADNTGSMSLYDKPTGEVVAPAGLETPRAGMPTLKEMPYSWVSIFDTENGRYPELLLDESGCVPQWVLDRWKARMGVGSGVGPSDPVGVRTAGVALTLSAGNDASFKESIPAVHARYPFRLAADVRRFKVHIRNHNDRASAPYPGAIQFTGIWAGAHAGSGAFASTPTQVSPAFTSNADASEYVTDWIEPSKFAIRKRLDYLFSLGYTTSEGQEVHKAIGGGWRGTTPADASVVNPSGLIESKTMPLDIWLEVELSASVPVGVSLGDSLTCGTASTLPVYDSYAARHALANGYVHQIMAHHGSAMSNWVNTANWKWAKYAGLSKPDSVLWALGGNDLTGTDMTLADAQARFMALLPLVKGLSPNFYLANIMPRNGNASFNALRAQYNEWLDTLPGGAINVFDFAKSVESTTNKDTINPRFNSGDNVHLNTAGYAKNAASITAPLAVVN